MGATILPILGDQRSWITAQALRPSRLVDYILVEEMFVVILSVLLLTLLLFAGLKYLRWKLILRGQAETVPLVTPSRAAWMSALGWGFLLPFALYLVCVSFPQVSGRSYNIIISAPEFSRMILNFSIWILLLPAIIMANHIRWRCNMEDLLPRQSSWQQSCERFGAVITTLAWIVLAAPLVLWVPVMVLMPLFTESPLPFAGLSGGIRIVVTVVMMLIACGLVLLPAVWEWKRPQMATLYCSQARAVLLVYAVLLLAVTALYPVLRGFEYHYIQQDRVMGIMHEKGRIAFTRAEGKLVLQLREQFNEGARRLQIPLD